MLHSTYYTANLATTDPITIANDTTLLLPKHGKNFQIPHIKSLKYTSNDNYLLMGNTKGFVHLLDIENNETTKRYNHSKFTRGSLDNDIDNLQLSTSNWQLKDCLFTNYDSKTFQWDLSRSRKPLNLIDCKQSHISPLKNNLLIAASVNSSISIHDLSETRRIRLKNLRGNKVMWCPKRDNVFALLNKFDSAVQIYDLRNTSMPTMRLNHYANDFNWLNESIVTASNNDFIYWDLEMGLDNNYVDGSIHCVLHDESTVDEAGCIYERKCGNIISMGKMVSIIDSVSANLETNSSKGVVITKSDRTVAIHEFIPNKISSSIEGKDARASLRDDIDTLSVISEISENLSCDTLICGGSIEKFKASRTDIHINIEQSDAKNENVLPETAPDLMSDDCITPKRYSVDSIDTPKDNIQLTSIELSDGFFPFNGLEVVGLNKHNKPSGFPLANESDLVFFRHDSYLDNIKIQSQKDIPVEEDNYSDHEDGDTSADYINSLEHEILQKLNIY